jgi:hypothetical protein
VKLAWIPKTFEQACKRAAGRRRYNAQRQRARDQRQLGIMGILVELNWPRYGIGRKLAKVLSVDPATISRDLKYIRRWRTTFIEEGKVSEEFANAIIRRLVVAGIHPRLGYMWSYQYNQGVSSLAVRSTSPYAYVFRPPSVPRR